MAIKIQSKNVWLSPTNSNNEVDLHYNPKNVCTYEIKNGEDEKFFKIKNNNKFMFVKHDGSYTFSTEVIASKFQFIDNLIIDTNNRVLTYLKDKFIFESKDNNKKYDELIFINNYHNFIDGIVEEDGILGESDENYNNSIVTSISEKEYSIIKHILINDKSILPKTLKLTNKYHRISKTGGNFLEYSFAEKEYKLDEVYKYNGVSNIKTYILFKIKMIYDKLIRLGVYIRLFGVRNIFLTYKDDKNIDVHIINFNSAYFLSNSFNEILEEVNGDIDFTHTHKDQRNYAEEPEDSIHTFEELCEYNWKRFVEDYDKNMNVYRSNLD
jgi:hypothetical protein